MSELPLLSAADDEHQSNSAWKRLYKVRSFSLDQETRRRRLLELQKKKRAEVHSMNRHISEVELDDDELDEDEMEYTVTSAKKRRPKKFAFAHKLMHSEWLIEVPQELQNEWYFLPCPAGKRCLVVAEGMITRAFSNSGKQLARFESLLPGGSHMSTPSRTLLDCVWSWKQSTYYVLDVLAWRNQPFLDCETEFRLAWLKSKLSELDGIEEIQKGNKYKFQALPYHQCSSSKLTEVMSGPQSFPDVMDGVLFYHREVHYSPGPSPLVVWLLPFMLPEVLGVSVSDSLMAQAPHNYPGHLEFVHKYQEQSRKERRADYRQRKAAFQSILDGEGDLSVEMRSSEPD